MAKTSTLRMIPWQEKLRPLFRLAADDWTPPRQISSVTSPARLSLTLTGRFTQPDGTQVKLTVRLKRPSVEAAWAWAEDKLDIRLFAKGPA